MAEYVTWRRMVSSTFVPLSGQMVGVEYGIDDDGATWENPVTVLGVQTQMVEVYTRPSRGKNDCGEPTLPPTAESLREEGYTFSWSDAMMSYVIHDSEIGPISDTDDAIRSENVIRVIFPARGDSPRDEESRRRAREDLAERHALRVAELAKAEVKGE